MILNLSKLTNQNIVLSNEDEQFIGTDLELQPFMIEIKRLSRADKINVATESVSENGTISSGEYSKAMFINSIVAVEGFTNENNEPITLEKQVRELVWEFAPDALVNAIKEKIDSFDIKEEKKSEEQEPVLADTPNG